MFSTFFPIILILIFVFMCYINFRIVAKFDQNTSFFENLIPVWNTYILAKQVMVRPGLYIIFMVMLPVVSGLVMLQILEWSFPTERTLEELQKTSLFFEVLQIAGAGLTAYLWGEVASALGKNRWLHRIMGVIYLPLMITVPMMAFDSSRPIKK